MKDLSNVPTTELLTEWQKFTAITINPNYARDLTFDKAIFEGRISAIATELNKRCSDAGMFTDGKGNLKTPCSIELPITEFCKLCEWLELRDSKHFKH